MPVTPSKKAHRRYHHSSSFKMAVFFTLLLGVSALFLGYFIYDVNQRGFIRETEAAIDAEITSFLELREIAPEQTIESLIARKESDASEQYYLYTTPTGEVLAGNMAAMPQDATPIKEGVIQFQFSSENPELIAAKIHTFSDGKRLLVGRDIDAIASSYRNIQLLSGITILLMLIVVATSFFISRFVVTRINIIADTARAIMDTGDLSRRIEIDSKWDDLSNLAQILNEMFGRIEVLMRNIREVSDNIAHDLRTPITRLRNKLEALESGKADPESAQELIKDADQMLETFNALLRIANIESGKRHYAFEKVQLDAIAEDVLELYAPLAEEKAITLKHTLSATQLLGDRDLLFQAIANVIDNAIKFTPEGGDISVKLEEDIAEPVLEVADSGCGLSDEEKPNVFRRFYRAEASRSTPGSGLGLSMVSAIVTLHNGKIALADNTPGLRVLMHFRKNYTDVT